MAGDNDGLTTMRAHRIDAPPQGERRDEGVPQPFLRRSMPDAGWLVVDLNESGAFVDVRTFSTPHDDYGVVLAWSATTVFLGNDAGVLMAYQVGHPPPKRCRQNVPSVGFGRLTVCLVGAAWLAGRGRSTDAWRVFTLCAVAVALLILTCPPLGAHGWPRA